MAEKATIYQTCQIGVETTPGTAVSATKKLLSASMAIKPRTEFDKYRPAGTKYTTLAAQGKEWSEIAISGKPSYNELPYFFSSLLHYAAPVQQGGSAAYKWTFESNNAAEDVGKTYTVEQGDGTANEAWRAAGVKVSGMTFDFNRNTIDMSGTAVGQSIETGKTLSSGVTSLAQVPVMPTQLKFYMADLQTDLATATAITRSFSMQWSLTDKFGLAWPVGQSPIAVEGEPNYSARIKIATDATGMGLISLMRAGTVKWFRIKAEGGLAYTGYNYTFQIDFPAVITEIGDMADQENIYAIEYGLSPIFDPSWGTSGKSLEIIVINTLSSL